MHGGSCYPLKVPVELWRFPDRTTEIGKMINAYLASAVELDNAAVHLLFSANRYEKRYVRRELHDMQIDLHVLLDSASVRSNLWKVFFCVLCL